MGSSVFPAASGGLTQKFSEFTATGTFTPPSSVSTVEVLLVAGGGGGGGNNNAESSAGGGGGGQVVKQFLTVTGGTSYTITIGAGGASNTVGANSSVGSLLICGGGGKGGQSGNSPEAGGNGTAGTKIAKILSNCELNISKKLNYIKN